MLADELIAASSPLSTHITRLNLPGRQTLPHEEFKRRTQQARTSIRTGEFSPYANIILIAGVVF